ncbi:hypothetical protein GOP47_0024863 [Adiantum capillus-veneris]|uniref:Uncharacterized protein n=1 Tax=Adiantum capillus-veneris TaxID=13818 RepID=A0A9D4Z306_ADICA|nr:hypothetical protein GOP47_0024863 [Adiantum capillus-veneris]
MASVSTQISWAVSDSNPIVIQASLCGCRGPSLTRTLYKPSGIRRQKLKICASSAAPYGPGGGSEIVDSNMSVLRKRIHRLQSLEAMEGAPEDWMDWEKSCYPSYRADVAYLMAGLQSQLLGIRPSVSLFILSVMLSAMPVASLLVLRFVIQQWVAHS